MELYEYILLGYSLLAFISYVAFIWIKFGVLSAISDSYYQLTNASKPMFTFFIWSVALPMIIVGVVDTPLMFFAGAFLSFVGAAPAFKEEMEGKVHCVGAVGGIGFGFLAMLLFYQSYIIVLLILGFVAYASLKKIKNYLWWIEVVSFISIYLSLIIYKLQSIYI